MEVKVEQTIGAHGSPKASDIVPCSGPEAKQHMNRTGGLEAVSLMVTRKQREKQEEKKKGGKG